MKQAAETIRRWAVTIATIALVASAIAATGIGTIATHAGNEAHRTPSQITHVWHQLVTFWRAVEGKN